MTPRLSSLLAVVPNRPPSNEPDADYLMGQARCAPSGKVAGTFTVRRAGLPPGGARVRLPLARALLHSWAICAARSRMRPRREAAPIRQGGAHVSVSPRLN